MENRFAQNGRVIQCRWLYTTTDMEKLSKLKGANIFIAVCCRSIQLGLSWISWFDASLANLERGEIIHALSDEAINSDGFYFILEDKHLLRMGLWVMHS